MDSIYSTFCLILVWELSFISYSATKRIYKKNFIFLTIGFLLMASFVVYTGRIFPVRFIYFLIIAIFLVFIYYPSKLTILEKSPVAEIGESSYFLYLIHEYVGVFIIYFLGRYIFPHSFFLPVMLILSFSFLSILFTKKLDQPINKYLKFRLINN